MFLILSGIGSFGQSLKSGDSVYVVFQAAKGSEQLNGVYDVVEGKIDLGKEHGKLEASDIKSLRMELEKIGDRKSGRFLLKVGKVVVSKGAIRVQGEEIKHVDGTTSADALVMYGVAVERTFWKAPKYFYLITQQGIERHSFSGKKCPPPIVPEGSMIVWCDGGDRAGASVRREEERKKKTPKEARCA